MNKNFPAGNIWALAKLNLNFALYSRKFLTILILIVGILGFEKYTIAATQNFPQKPVHIVVPFPAGATLDSVVRLVAEQLSKTWSQPVIVENKTGASGIVGVSAVAKAKPDGYTMVAVSNSFAANTILRRDMPYDAFQDFDPITLLGSVPHVITLNSSVPAKTIKQLITYMHENPGTLSYASGGSGTMSHLGAEMFKRATNTDMIHIPYRGQGPALIDVVSGQVEMTLGNISEVIPHAKSGKVRMLAVMKPNRSKLAPDIPTLAEVGYPEIESDSWYGLVAPAGTPKDILKAIQEAVAKAFTDTNVSEPLLQQGFEASGITPSDFNNFLHTQVNVYKKVIDEANIKIE